MRIGYACLTVGVPGTQMHTCIQKNATPQRLLELIDHNLRSLENMIDYNKANEIKLFRISSDIIPFGSSPVNDLKWEALFADTLRRIGDKAQQAGMRLSMHPGQYTVINSPSDDVVCRAVEDLQYHTKFLDALGLDATHKIILHVGGIYGDKDGAMKRFAHIYKGLDDAIRKRLVIENDDKAYNIQEVFELGSGLNIPVVLDNLHHQVNGCGTKRTLEEWARLCAGTWKLQDGPQKLHYSQQATGKRPGSHSQSVNIDAFLDYRRQLTVDPDVMLEVKDKNLSAVKCILATVQWGRINLLEREWSRYKYVVLERSPNHYQQIRKLLHDKNAYPAVPFYRLVEEALAQEPTIGTAVNALQHVWGYFREVASQKEMDQFQRELQGYSVGEKSLVALKRMLLRLAEKYSRSYLLESLYFVL